MLNKITFRSRLLLGFWSILLLFFISTVFFIFQNRKIADYVDMIYNHPLMVSRAVRDIQIEIYEILYSNMEDVVAANNEAELKAAIAKVNENDMKIEENFNIINERFLGDMMHVKEASQIYKEWKTTRKIIIELKKNRQDTAAFQFREQIGFPKATLLSQKFKNITDFAKSKSDELYKRIKKTEQKRSLFLMSASFVILVFSILIALYISKSITSPIRKFISEIKQLINSGNIKISNDISENKIFEITKNELSAAYIEIIKFNKELEQKVEQRTNELHDINEEIIAQNEEISAQNEEYQALNEEYKTQNETLMYANGMILESEKKLNLALENGNIGTWEMNLVTQEMTLDKRMEKILNLEPSLFKISYEAFEKCVHQEDTSHIRNAINKALKDDIPFETIFRVVKKNGDVNYINSKALVVKDGKGNPVKLSGVCFDITDMKKGAEQVLFKLNEELLRSNQELQSFAFVASHDLKEPLRMVSNFTQLISMRYGDRLDQDGKDFIKFAVEGSKRMDTVINSLLEYSRMQSAILNFSEVNMNSVIDKVCKNLKLNIDENKANIIIEKLPFIYADESQMIHLLQNLVSNAIKFKRGTPEIQIKSKEENNHYLFSVKDNGIGIDPQYFEKIFEIFKRLHTKEKYDGTGIGLAICKRIVERHKGKIWVESESGIGSTFFFTIPKK